MAMLFAYLTCSGLDLLLYSIGCGDCRIVWHSSCSFKNGVDIHFRDQELLWTAISEVLRVQPIAKALNGEMALCLIYPCTFTAPMERVSPQKVRNVISTEVGWHGSMPDAHKE